MPRTLKSAATRQKSLVWNYMTRLNAEIAVCNICKREMSFSGSTSAMRRHIKSQHGIIAEPLRQGKTVPSVHCIESLPKSELDTNDTVLAESSQKKRKPFTPVREEQRVKRKPGLVTSRQFDNSILTIITTDLHPLSIVESKGFQNLMAIHNSSYTVISKDSLASELLPERYAEEKTKLMKEMESVPHLSITSEFWHSQDTEFLTVTAHFINQEWNYVSRILSTRSVSKAISGQLLAEELVSVFQQWGVESKVSTMVTDGAANVKEAAEILGLQHHSCFAHSLNLAVNNAIQDTEEVISCRARLREIVLFFHQNPAAEKNLKKAHNSLATEYEKLKLDEESCWYSMYDMIASYSSQHQEVVHALNELGREDLCATTQELITMEHIINSLAPFYEATLEMANESQISAAKIIPLVFLLIQCISNEDYDLSKYLALRMTDQFAGIEATSHLMLSTLLDPRFNSTGFSNSSHADAAVEILKSTLQTIEPKSEKSKLLNQSVTPLTKRTSSLWNGFDARIQQKIKNSSPSQYTLIVESETCRYLDSSCISRDNDPLVWWKEHGPRMPKLEKIAKDILSIPATTLPSNRLFGQARELFSIRRGLLEPEYVDMILFLHNVK